MWETERPFELQVYADAGRREDLDVRAAYVRDMKTIERHTVPVDESAVARAEAAVAVAAARIRARDYAPNPGARCRRCEMRTICRFAQH